MKIELRNEWKYKIFGLGVWIDFLTAPHIAIAFLFWDLTISFRKSV